MKRKLSHAALLLLLAALAIGGTRFTYANHSQNITFTPLPLDTDRPELSRVGQLEYLGGWQLRSNNQDFGGISALARQNDGRFFGVSDAGTLIGFGLSDDPDIDRPFIAPLPDAFSPGKNFRDRDSESLTHDPATNRFWIGFEARTAIRRYAPSFAREEAMTRPNEMTPWDGNSGPEALARLHDGRFVTISEGQDRPDGSYEGLVFSSDPTNADVRIKKFGYQPPVGFKITDMVQLPDRRIIALNRRVAFPKGFECKVTLFDPADITEDAVIHPRTIAFLISPLLVDNMEGVTFSTENGRTIIWMVSDDNFAVYQRTLLMKFALLSDPPGIKKPELQNSPGFESLK
jgi:hypothetical protein